MEEPKESKGAALVRLFITALVVGSVVAIIALASGCARGADKMPPKPPHDVYVWCEARPTDENCAWLLANAPETVAPPTVLEKLEPWAVGFLILVMVGVLTWYFRTFSQLAFIGDRFCEAVGGRQRALKIIATIEADNATLLAGALSAHAFGVHKDPKP